GRSTFWSTMDDVVVLVLLHRLPAMDLYQWPSVALAIKGRPHVLVEKGNLRQGTMRRNHISPLDLEEYLRLEAKRSQAGKGRPPRGKWRRELYHIQRNSVKHRPIDRVAILLAFASNFSSRRKVASKDRSRCT